jgi:hypothetical protein
LTTNEISLAPIDRTLFEQTSLEVRRQVHPELFNPAWAQGQTMTLDETVAYALGQPESIRDG